MRLAGEINRKIAKKFGITPRRVRQIYSRYCNEKVYHKLRKPGKQIKELTNEEKKLIDKAYKEIMSGAVVLEKYIKRKYKIHIPHNRIHMGLKSKGYAKEEKRKQKQRKWIRYERKHSLSLIHVDWHEENEMKLITFEDDASRCILAAGEFPEATLENTIKVLKQAIKEGKKYGPIIQIITDNGTQFCVPQGPIRSSRKTRFEKILEKHEIQHIKTRVKHPQTNGKLEKFHHLYDRRRNKFKSLKAFVKWYNETRPHMSLDFDKAETPSEAFTRKMRPEYYVGMASRLGWW